MTDEMRKLNLRLTEDEHAKLVALAEDEERSINTLMRRLVRERYAARFGARAGRLGRTMTTKGGR